MNLPNDLQTFREKEFTQNVHDDGKAFDKILEHKINYRRMNRLE